MKKTAHPYTTTDTFDYVIIGTGSAGSVIANKLSADPNCRVAIIEAGPSDLEFPTNLKTRLPMGNILLIPHAKYNWQHTLTTGESTAHRKIGFPRGKLMGGCTSINGGVYIRGQATDYEEWQALGNEGWSFDDVLPSFRMLENYQNGENERHGVGGELDVQKPREFNPLSQAFVDAAEQAGHSKNNDFAGEVQDGFGQYDVNQRNGVRLSTSRAFLHPILKRPNVKLFTNTMARRIIINRGRATGVEVEKEGRRFVLNARAEVVLSAGAIGSPQILMLSGIGPAAHLEQLDIPVQHNLPGVGANLQDHPTVHLSMENPTGESHAMSLSALPRMVISPFKYVFSHNGMLATNVAEAGGFVDTTGGTRPDIQMTFLVGLKSNARTVPSRHGHMILIQLLRPKSVGNITLTSADPYQHPKIDPNFFGHPDDMATLMRGFKEARRIMSQPALAALSGNEIEPGAQLTSDEQIEQALRDIVNTAYHPCGTCKMGPDNDPMAVVDNRLRVRGIAGLRLADASIMPKVISGNTSAPTMMIGARAASFITEDQKTSNRTAFAESD